MTTEKIYLHRSLAPDILLGHVDENGKVYETRFGPDKYVGRVEAESGKIFAAQLGPDDYIGRVDLENGKVYRAVFGPDEYLGRVEDDGRMYYHLSMARDAYVGILKGMSDIAHGGAAYLLLVLPEVEAELTDEEDTD